MWVDIPGRRIGDGSPCFLVAEIGINHNGDLGLARRLCEEAAKAGADGVKFQNYRTEDFLSDRSLTYTYRSQGELVTESQWEMFKRCEAGPGWLVELKHHCDRLGIAFFSTPTSAEGVGELVDAGAPLIKNGSDYLTHVPLLEDMGRTGVPVIVSTGMADLEDVDQAVAAVRRGGRSALMLLHCTSAYPTPLEAVNLRRMLSLRQRYGVPVGFSDHTEGWEAAAQAVTLGASLIEKHFTLSHDLPGPDHWFSSTPEEFGELVRRVREAEQRMGSAIIAPAAQEQAARREYRLSTVAVDDLPAGSLLSPGMVAFRRPGGGILPRDLPEFLGRRLARAVPKGTPLTPADCD